MAIEFTGTNFLNSQRFIEINPDKSFSTSRPVVHLRKDPTLQIAADSLRTIESVVRRLGSDESFSATRSTSSDPDVLVPSVTGGANVGTHTVEVTQLAQKQITASQNGYVNSTDTVADGGSISFTVNGANTSAITITSTTTLADLKSQINDQNSGIVASIANNGIEDRLVITSRESGKGQGFTINNSLTNSVGPVLAFESGQSSLTGNTQNALNAHFIVDNVEFSRTSNAVHDAIDGMTFTLKKKGKSSVTASTDHTAIRTATDTLVAEHNRLHNVAQSLGSSRSHVQDRLRMGTAVTSAIGKVRAAFSANGVGRLNTVAEVGLTVKNSGKLDLDSKKLEAALSDSPAEVKTLFSHVFGRLGQQFAGPQVATGTIATSDVLSPKNGNALLPQINRLRAQAKGFVDAQSSLGNTQATIRKTSAVLGRISMRVIG